MSYGAIAEVVRERDGHRASARSVGSVMARFGGAVPWHRVVNSAGRTPPGHERRARERLEAEGVPFRNDVVTGPGGSQILVQDPAGNIIELFQPADQ